MLIDRVRPEPLRRPLPLAQGVSLCLGCAWMSSRLAFPLDAQDHTYETGHPTVYLSEDEQGGQVNAMRTDVDGGTYAAAALDELAGTPDLLLSAARRERNCRYTLHLDFEADDPTAARELAAALAEALGILRTQVQTYSAAVSAGGMWGEVEPVFCMADGPEGAFCAYVAGHPGWHAEGGVDGLRWGDGDGDGMKG